MTHKIVWTSACLHIFYHIEWAIARVPPTPPFWLKGGSAREVRTRFFCRCCRRIIQKNHGMTSTLLTGTLFGLLDWCLQIRKSVALIQITKNFSNKYISIFYAPWQTSMFSIQISSQVHQKIALGLHCRSICATAHLRGALGGFKGLSLAKYVFESLGGDVCCEGAVTSKVRTGQVWHRPCGRFRVKDGRVADRRFVYCCPFCGGNVASTVQTGQVDHRTICGNRFYVREGSVSMATRQQRRTCPACGAAVWSAHLSGRIRVTHSTPSGKPCSKQSWQVGQWPWQASQAWLKPAAAQSKEFLGVGKALRSGQGPSVSFEIR